MHLGDYVSPLDLADGTVLTTVDQPGDLEAYIYIPTERSSQARLGLDVELYDTSGKLLEKSKIDFLSPQVDPNLQGILAKAPVHATPDIMRNAQLIKARVIWSTKPMVVVPVLAVTRQAGQTFVFVARKQPNGQYIAAETPVTLGDTVENSYSVTSGLNCGRPGGGVEHAVPCERNAGFSDSWLSMAARLQAMRLMALAGTQRKRAHLVC